MKKLLTMMMVAAFFGCPLFGALTDGLVAHYKFDGNANDSSGNAYHLSGNNYGFCENRLGNVGGALNCEEMTMLRPSAQLEVEGSFSIAFWVKPTCETQLYTERTGGTCYDGSFVLDPGQCTVHGSWEGTGIGVAVGKNGVVVYEHGANYLPAVLSYDFNIGEHWTHVLVNVANNGAPRLFVNGELVRTGVESQREFKCISFGPEVAGGGGGLCDEHGFTGALDDFRIYNRALSAAEVKALYEEENDKGLVAWYKFDGNADDSSGNDYNLVNQGANFVADRHDVSGGAVYFDGDSKLIPSANWLMAEEGGTIACWIKADRGIESFYSESTSGTRYDAPYAVFPVNGDNLSGETYGNVVGVGFAYGNNGVMIYEHAGGYLPTPLVYRADLSGWRHVAVTFEKNGREQLFIDGILVRTGLTSDKLKTFGMSANKNWASGLQSGIGGSEYGNFTGSMDDLRIYNRALSAAEVKALYEGDGAPVMTKCAVTFDAAGGMAEWTKGEVVKGAAIGTLPTATREGYEFLGWYTAAVGGTQVTAATVVTGNVTYYAQWTPIRYAITYVNTMGAANPNPTSYTIEDAVTFAALPDVEGWRFVGWSFAGISRGNTGDVTVFANWEAVTPSVIPDEEEPMDAGVANTYDGIIMDADGLPVGYISIKAGKASGKGEVKTSKVTATIQMAGETKKVTVKGNVNVSEATLVQHAPDGRVLDLIFTRNSIFGTFDDYEIEGVRNILASTAKGDKGSEAKQRAENVYNRLKGNYVMAYGDENGWNGLSVSIMTKGKVKVSGALADGTKVSTSTQMIVGEDYSCIPVIYTKKNVSLAFSIYFSNRGDESFVFGYYDAVISRVAALDGERVFCLDGDLYGLFDEAGYELVEDYLPWEVSVAPKGTKWIVADGVKAGQIKMDKDGEVYDAKESDNPSGLKLTFTAKTGLFKGSFKVYAIDAKGKLKSFSATVHGIVVDGLGYGTATIKKIGSVPVAIE